MKYGDKYIRDGRYENKALVGHRKITNHLIRMVKLWLLFQLLSDLFMIYI